MGHFHRPVSLFNLMAFNYILQQMTETNTESQDAITSHKLSYQLFVEVLHTLFKLLIFCFICFTKLLKDLRSERRKETSNTGTAKQRQRNSCTFLVLRLRKGKFKSHPYSCAQNFQNIFPHSHSLKTDLQTSQEELGPLTFCCT